MLSGFATNDVRLPGESNNQFAYRVLYSAIMHLQLEPGQLISVHEISTILGMSRTPIREALFRLRDDRLIDLFPQSSTNVSYIDYNLVQEGLSIRSNLEAIALRYICEHFDSCWNNTINERIGKNLKMQQMVANGDLSATVFYDYDNEFHELLFDAAHKEWSWQITNKACTHTNRVRFLHLREYNPDITPTYLYNTHLNIIEYIKKQDVNNLLAIDYKHICHHDKILEKPFGEDTKYFVNIPSFPVNNGTEI